MRLDRLLPSPASCRAQAKPHRDCGRCGRRNTPFGSARTAVRRCRRFASQGHPAEVPRLQRLQHCRGSRLPARGMLASPFSHGQGQSHHVRGPARGGGGTPQSVPDINYRHAFADRKPCRACRFGKVMSGAGRQVAPRLDFLPIRTLGREKTKTAPRLSPEAV